MSAPRCASSNRGFALVIVLWMLTLLALLAAAFGKTTRSDALRTVQLADRIKGQSLAQAAIERGIFELMQPPHEAAWKTDGTAYAVRLGEAELTVALWSERGKHDLNLGAPELRRALLIQAGAGASEADALIDAIEDWKDADDLKRLEGAEVDDYRAAGRPAGPANRPFESIAQLQQVLGVRPEIYACLVPWITVHSLSPAIHSLSAPAELLRAQPGIDPDSLEEFLAAREAMEYNDPSSPIQGLATLGGLASGDPGQIFTIRGTALLPSKVAVSREVVVWIEDRLEGRHWTLDVRDEP